jgi:hypothetical protein
VLRPLYESIGEIAPFYIFVCIVTAENHGHNIQ